MKQLQSEAAPFSDCEEREVPGEDVDMHAKRLGKMTKMTKVKKRTVYTSSEADIDRYQQKAQDPNADAVDMSFFISV